MQLHSRTCTWALNPPDLLISQSSFQTHYLVAQPHDINMQISVDNNARPPNQQIINSPCTSYSTRQFHMWKKVLMHHAAKKHQTTSMLWKSVIDYTVREPPTFLARNLMEPMEMWPGPQNYTRLMRWESWSRRDTVGKLPVLARGWHYHSSLQMRTKNRCCLSIPNNSHELRYHGNADALEKCCVPQLKHIILERLLSWFNHQLCNCCPHSSGNDMWCSSRGCDRWHLPVEWREFWSHRGRLNKNTASLQLRCKTLLVLFIFRSTFKCAAGFFYQNYDAGLQSYILSIPFHGNARKQGYFWNIFPHFTSSPAARLLTVLQAIFPHHLVCN